MHGVREHQGKMMKNIPKQQRSICLKFWFLFFFFFKCTKTSWSKQKRKQFVRPFPLRVVSFETERWRCDGAAAASSTAWRQTVNPEGGRWDTSWWKKLYFGPNDIHNIWVQPHPRQRGRPFLLSRHNIQGKRRYREHSEAHSFYALLPNVFFLFFSPFIL